VCDDVKGLYVEGMHEGIVSSLRRWDVGVVGLNEKRAMSGIEES